MRYYVTFPSGDEVPVDVTYAPTGELVVESNGRRVEADATTHRGGSSTCMRIDGRVVDLWMEGAPPEVGVVVGATRFYANVESERMRALSAALGSKHASGEGLVASPMPGRVLKLLVAEGDRVEAGTPLVVVEAMKMENELCSGRDGVVHKVFVTPGSTVESGARLIEIQ
jgi:biotin carboxyl carrier protein